MASRIPFSVQPGPTGLYNPDFEKDACGLALIARYKGGPDHEVVEQALTALRNMEHRGGVGGDDGTGDGAGIMVAVPDSFLRTAVDFELPEAGQYAVGIGFLNPDDADADRALVEKLAGEEGLRILGWREVPVDASVLGESALSVKPAFYQLFVDVDPAVPGHDVVGDNVPSELERRAFTTRKRAQIEGVYFASLSSRTMTYKGMVTTAQLGTFYLDLADDSFATNIALVHSRFSTNTFPSWPLAQPFRFIAHNGEINTIRGNRAWMKARESQLAHPALASPWGDGSHRDLSRLFPIVSEGFSDSASFDEVLELLVMSGRSLPHALMMMIPETWENDPHMSEERRAFYAYHAYLMEPWDGPACMAFTDGRYAGGVLDRNGLRPARYVLTDDTVVLASEVGVIDLPHDRIIKRGRLKPGRMFLVDTLEERVISDTEIKTQLATAEPYGKWIKAESVALGELPDREHIKHSQGSILRRQKTFGFTDEELRLLVGPMAETGAEPLGAMGSDTPIAALADRPRLIFDYFVQNFAQVTNPPLDAIREKLVTSLSTSAGPEGNILNPGPQNAQQVTLARPVIDNDELAKIVSITDVRLSSLGERPAHRLRAVYKPGGGGANLARRIEELCTEATDVIAAGSTYLIISDRGTNSDYAPIPSLLITAAIHNHLVREKSRTKVSLIVEAGDVRETHHVATLMAFGASAINPYLAMESVELMVRQNQIAGVNEETAVNNLVDALNAGLLKIMSKMGISTVQSYCGAQTFETLGLSQAFVDKFFTGTPVRLAGIGLPEIAREIEARHSATYPGDHPPLTDRPRELGGEYQWRREGPPHLYDPETISTLQHATRTKNYEMFKAYSRRVDEQAAGAITLRSLLELSSDREPISIDDVEPVESIVKRFSTGAMSYGSISKEAHETLALAMNQLGAKSNTGEGGEDPDRLMDPQRRSAVKQVASGRFGVTSLYLTEASDIQIKMAQGAKPGEGGQLPGTKVYPWVAKTRHATPGVGLISPPPHHDIYSIEDLAQLIYDLKMANPKARIHVKLVASGGIGTVAAGVAKAGADVIMVSGHDGGTGASPMNSIKHAGEPWELGLAETQQTLVLSGLRDRVVVQTDGQMKTGRDVIIAALLGAEEYGFATAPLVVSGCVLMRVCHKDTCPVGIATQNPTLRERYAGRVEDVVTFFTYIAQEVREYLAELGFRSLDEAVGQVEYLKAAPERTGTKSALMDLSPILELPRTVAGDVSHVRTFAHPQADRTHDHFDQQVLDQVRQVIETRESASVSLTATNVDRSIGTLAGNTITAALGTEELDDDAITLNLTGYAGQSMGAFIPKGLTISLEGDANDYVAKGISGGIVAVRQSASIRANAEDNVIAGNVIGYGATSGKIFVAGQVGERFLVRNSGAHAVAEGVGDHGLEYMTGGTAVILGSTGKNFAAGMSGGTAYVLNFNPTRLNAAEAKAGTLYVGGLNQSDADQIVALLREHERRTASAQARQLLADFDAGDDVLARFTKIEPVAYRSVLTTQEEAQAAGEDSEATWKKILEVTIG